MLDLDATDTPLHGRQEARFFHGYYGHYCYLPLYVFCGDHLLCARLRPSNIDASAGSLEEVRRIVRQIRARWPKTRIILRADSGFCREELLAWCENRGIFIFIALVLALGGVILLLFPREPHYQGRSLSSWLQQCYDTPLNETQRLSEAQAAVRAIGEKKSVPVLLKLVETKEDPFSTWLLGQREKLRIDFLHWRSAEDWQQLGIAGFEALETNAAPAVAELTELLKDKEHAFVAVRCLVAIGPPAEPSVSQALTNQSVQVRYFATQQFAWVTDNDEVYLSKMRECLEDPDGSVRFAAVQGIGLQTQAPDLAITLLLEALRDKQDTVASWAAKFLANFGTNAMRAFPDLSNAVEHGNPNTVNQALKTLVVIAPDKALPIVFENFRSAIPTDEKYP